MVFRVRSFVLAMCATAYVACGSDEQSGGPGGAGGSGAGGSGPGSCLADGLPCGGCPANTFCWDHPSTIGGALTDVSASDDANVWMRSGTNTIASWDGEAWQTWYLPAEEQVKDVSAVPGGAWLATSAGLYRYAGGGWSRQTLPEEMATVSVIHGVATAQVWVANAMHAAVLDGSWTLHSLPGNPLDLYAPTVDEAFVATDGLHVSHFANGEWMTETLGGMAPLYGLTGSGPDNVWVMDSRDVPAQRLHHWDGSSWTDQEAPSSTGSRGLSARGDKVWVPGQGGTIYVCAAGGACNTEAPLGSFQGAYPFASDLSSVAMTEESGWAVGGSAGHVLRLDASSGWQAVGPAPDADFGSIVSPTPGTTWASGVRELHQRADGAWTRHGPTGPPIFAGTFFVESPDSVWSVFSHRGLWHLDGGEWTLVDTSEAIDEAKSVFASGEDVWAVVPGSQPLRLVDGTWTPVEVDMLVARIWGRSSSAIYFVGSVDDAGALLLHDGQADFQPVDFGGGKITGSFEQADGTLWLLVARDDAMVLVHVTGTTSEDVAEIELDFAGQLWAGGEDDVWVTGGRQGTAARLALHWDGSAGPASPPWRRGRSPPTAPMCSSPGRRASCG
jgi:hypothetical protein